MFINILYIYIYMLAYKKILLLRFEIIKKKKKKISIGNFKEIPCYTFHKSEKETLMDESQMKKYDNIYMRNNEFVQTCMH